MTPKAASEWSLVWLVAAFTFDRRLIQDCTHSETLDLIENVELQMPLETLCAALHRPQTVVMLKVASLVFEGRLMAISPCVFDAMVGRIRDEHIQNGERFGQDRREYHG